MIWYNEYRMNARKINGRLDTAINNLDNENFEELFSMILNEYPEEIRTLNEKYGCFGANIK